MEDIVREVETWVKQHRRKNAKFIIKRKVLKYYLENNKPFVCCYCKIPLTLKKVILEKDIHVLPENFLTLEHIKPMSHFFNSDFDRSKVEMVRSHPCNKLDNLELSCYKCNISLGDKKKQSTENNYDRLR
jgi:hypothetical protein